MFENVVDLQKESEIELKNETTVTKFKKEFWSVALYLVSFFAIVSIIIVVLFTPKIEGAKKLWMLFCILPPMMFLVLFLSAFRDKYIFLIVQNSNQFYLRFVTSGKCVYSDGERTISYTINKRKRVIQSKQYVAMDTEKDSIFIKVYYKTRREQKETWEINQTKLASSWCKKCELKDYDKILSKILFVIRKDRLHSKQKYEWISDYPVVNSAGGSYGVKYKSISNDSMVGKLKIVFDDDMGGSGDNGGGRMSIVYVVKQFHNLNNFNDIKYKDKSVYCIIQMICKDTGMQMPKQ